MAVPNFDLGDISDDEYTPLCQEMYHPLYEDKDEVTYKTNDDENGDKDMSCPCWVALCNFLSGKK